MIWRIARMLLSIYFNIFSRVNKCFKIKLQNITLGKVSFISFFSHNILDMLLFFNAAYFFFGL